MIIIHIDIYLNIKENPVKLPINYNYIVQSAIYNSIDHELADFLHNTGYCIKKRTFKLFSFSRLFGKFKINSQDKTISFYNIIKLTITSPIDVFCESLVNTLLTKGQMCFLDNLLEIESIQLRKVVAKEESIKVKTLSPIVVYSTLYRNDNSKYTCYFSPYDPDFEKLIFTNLINKCRALNKEKEIETTPNKFKIAPLGRVKPHIVTYKGIVVKGFSGNLSISAPKPYLQLLLEAGLGSKNSQGFGCVDVVS